ncbi:MAG: hypothetical protein ACTSQS_15800, partial [Promethearchaeota archaeon]
VELDKELKDISLNPYESSIGKEKDIIKPYINLIETEEGLKNAITVSRPINALLEEPNAVQQVAEKFKKNFIIKRKPYEQIKSVYPASFIEKKKKIETNLDTINSLLSTRDLIEHQEQEQITSPPSNILIEKFTASIAEVEEIDPVIEFGENILRFSFRETETILNFFRKISNIIKFDPNQNYLFYYQGQIFKIGEYYKTVKEQTIILTPDTLIKDFLLNIGYPYNELNNIKINDKRWKNELYRIKLYYENDPIVKDLIFSASTKKVPSFIKINILASYIIEKLGLEEDDVKSKAIKELYIKTGNFIFSEDGLIRMYKIGEQEGFEDFAFKMNNLPLPEDFMKTVNELWIMKWEERAKKEDLTKEQIKKLIEIGEKIFDKCVMEKYENTENGDDIILKALYNRILYYLFTKEVQHPETEEKVKMYKLEYDKNTGKSYYPQLLDALNKELDNLIAERNLLNQFLLGAALQCALYQGVYYDINTRMLRQNFRLNTPNYFDSGSLQEAKAAISDLPQKIAKLIKRYKNIEYMYSDMVKDITAMTDDLTIFSSGITPIQVKTDYSPGDVLGRHWFKITIDDERVIYKIIQIESKAISKKIPTRLYLTQEDGIGRDIMEQITLTNLDIIHYKKDMDSVEGIITMKHPKFNKLEFKQTILDLLKSLNNKYALKGINGDIKKGYAAKVFKSLNYKKWLIDFINRRLFENENIDFSNYNSKEKIKEFIRNLYSDNTIIKNWIKRIYIKKFTEAELQNELNQMENNFDNYFGNVYFIKKNNLIHKYGFSFSGTTAFYFTSENKIYFDDIPKSVRILSGFQSTKGIKTFFDDDKSLKGSWALAYRMIENNFEYKLIPLKQTKSNSFLRGVLSEKEIKDGWHLGYAGRDMNGNYILLPQAFMVLNGKKLNGWVHFEKDNVIYKPNWYENTQIWNKIGDYGIELLAVSSTNVGPMYTYIYHKDKISSAKLFLDIDEQYTEPFFDKKEIHEVASYNFKIMEKPEKNIEFMKEANALCLLIGQLFAEPLKSGNFYIFDNYFNLHYDEKNKYSIMKIKQIFERLKPKEGDEILDPIKEPEILDPNSQKYWLKDINRIIFDKNKIINPKFEHGKFYGKLLDLIKNYIKRTDKEGKDIFENFGNIQNLKEAQFSESFLSNNIPVIDENTEENDFNIIDNVNDAMIHAMGFDGFISFLLGEINFIEVEGKIIMKTAPLSGTNYNSAFNRMKIINMMTGNIPKTSYPSKKIKEMVICSHIFGIKMNLKGEYYDENGNLVKKNAPRLDIKILPPQDEELIAEYFVSYFPKTRNDYKSILSHFKKNYYYGEFLLNYRRIKELHTFGRREFRSLIRKHADEIIERTFDDPKLLEKYPEFKYYKLIIESEALEIYKARAKHYASELIAYYVDRPGVAADYVGEIMNAYREHRDAIITLKSPEVSNNPLFSGKGLRVVIPYAEIRELSFQALFTGTYTYTEGKK